MSNVILSILLKTTYIDQLQRKKSHSPPKGVDKGSLPRVI